MKFKSGLCCISLINKSKDLSFKTITWKIFSSLPKEDRIKRISSIYLHNAKVIRHNIDLCALKKWNYRVSSDIFPLMTHPEFDIKFDELPDKTEIYRYLAECKEISALNGIRLSCHPDQFNVLPSESEKTVKQTIIELNYHGWFMDLLSPDNKMPHESPINIHLNLSKGNLEDIAKRFKDNFDKLDQSSKSRLVVEVEDKGQWNARNLIDIFYPIVSIPITFDYLHHKCNPNGLSEEESFNLCYNTWKTRPLFHYSESIPNEKNARKHASIPLEIPTIYGEHEIDLDMEFKDKDYAILEMENLILASALQDKISSN